MFHQHRNEQLAERRGIAHSFLFADEQVLEAVVRQGADSVGIAECLDEWIEQHGTKAGGFIIAAGLLEQTDLSHGARDFTQRQVGSIDIKIWQRKK
jgi:hypothetical protein